MLNRLTGRQAAVLSLCLAIALVTGCSLLQDRDARLQLAVQYATLKTIDRSASSSAEDVLDGVARARAVVDRDEAVTIGLLADQVRATIRWERLDVADRLLLDAVLQEAEAELARRIGEGMLKPEDRVAVLTLLDWIAAAAAMY